MTETSVARMEMERGETRRTERARGARGLSPAGGAPWAGLVALGVAIGLWATVIAGVAAPLGAWLSRVDAAAGTRPPGVATETAAAEPAPRQVLVTGAWSGGAPASEGTP